MGIEEAILQEVREKSEKRGEKRGETQTKIKGIQKALERNKLTLNEIAEDFEVSLEFVKQVQSGEVK